jgi:hypothetical protein
VFLAYYLRTDAFEGATAIGFAFVGGLSISMGECWALHQLPPYALFLQVEQFID